MAIAPRGPPGKVWRVRVVRDEKLEVRSEKLEVRKRVITRVLLKASCSPGSGSCTDLVLLVGYSASRYARRTGSRFTSFRRVNVVFTRVRSAVVHMRIGPNAPSAS